MRRLALPALFVGLAIIGCNRGPTVVVVQPSPPTAPTPVANAPGSPTIPAPELSVQERYDAAVWTAATLLTDRKYAEALASLEQAQRIQDTDQVRREIARVKVRLDAARAADRTVRDIQTILTDGKPDEAARLAAAALCEYGDSDAADAIIRLKRQADALVSVSLDPTARMIRYDQESKEAVRSRNARAIELAYEQLQTTGDGSFRDWQSETRTNLTRYDDARRQAAELRRDPARLEDALAALQVAAQAWDSAQVRQEIADCKLAMQFRRERLGIADFETRGDVGAPQLGRTVAEELLPAFKSRYDIVERGQLTKVCNDLKLQGADLIDQENGRRELARLANVRYLVVGSVTRLGGITIHARLLDLQTGLIVQTAKVAAPTPETLMPLLPQLAAMLQMSDDQRLAYEKQLAQQAAVIPVAAEAIPPLPIVGAPGTAINFTTTRPPEFGGAAIDDFRQLPPPGQAAFNIQLAFTKDHKVRARALSVSLELGDDLLRRGRYQEAHAQFQVALGLSPGKPEIVARLGRCTPYLQAPPVVVVQSRPVVVQPRVAVLDFVTAGDPGLVLPGLGTWAAENVAPYLCPPYDVADRGEVYWYMSRLGVTLRDAVVDPLARLYLGRALNVRFVVLGTLRATPGGLEVVAHLLDVETGAEVNTASAVARDRGELKCRLGEIARWLLLDPAERLRREAEAAQSQALLAQAETAAKQSNFSLAIELTKKAGHKTPGIRVEVLLDQFDRQNQFSALEVQRRAEWEQQQVLVAAAIRRQQELAAAAEAARVAAAQQAAAISTAERQRQRDQACQQLLIQARAARDAQNFTIAVQLYESAQGIDRRDEIARESALVRARAEEQARAHVAAETAAREVTLRQQREIELTRVQAQLESERQQRAAAEQARRRAQEDAGRAKIDAEARLRADLGINADADARARAEVDAKRQADLRNKADAEARARADVDAKARADAKRQADLRIKADAEARARADADAKARADTDLKRLADAKIKADQDARLKAEAEARARAAKPPIAAPLVPPPPKPATPLTEMASYAQHMQAGDALQRQEKFGDASRAYQAALRAAPNDAVAQKRADYAQHMDAGLTALKAGKKMDAAREFEAALKSAPNDPTALKWLQQTRR